VPNPEVAANASTNTPTEEEPLDSWMGGCSLRFRFILSSITLIMCAILTVVEYYVDVAVFGKILSQMSAVDAVVRFGLPSFVAGVIGVVIVRRDGQSAILVTIFKWISFLIFTLGIATAFVTLLMILATVGTFSVAGLRSLWTPLINSVVAIVVGLPTFMTALRASELFDRAQARGGLLQVQLSESLPLLGGRRK